MQSFTFKSLLGYIGVFALTFVTGTFIVGTVSPAKESGFEFGRGHRARDRKLEAELERMQELNEQLQERLSFLEAKMKADALRTVPSVPEIPAVPENGDAPKAVPGTPQLKTKAREQASF